MTDLNNVLWIEFRKVFRSKVPFFCNLGFLIGPLMIAVLMFIYKDPAFARKIGILGVKAQIIGKSADWPSFISMLIVIVAMMGIFVFSLLESWIFGREFADRTLKDMLAVPVSRGTIVAGKFIVLVCISMVMVVEMIIVGLIAGFAMNLPQGSSSLILDGVGKTILASMMVLLVNTPFAFLASTGKGYLLPIGVTMLVVVIGNLMGTIGYGEIYPWYIPGILSGMAAEGSRITAGSYIIIFLTAILGVAATSLWWQKADHHQ
jgi:ABC-2 type transport system permease protein